MQFVYQLVNAGYEDSNNHEIHTLSAEHFNQLLDTIVFDKRNVGINTGPEQVLLEFDNKGSGIAFGLNFGRPTLTLYKAN